MAPPWRRCVPDGENRDFPKTPGGGFMWVNPSRIYPHKVNRAGEGVLKHDWFWIKINHFSEPPPFYFMWVKPAGTQANPGRILPHLVGVVIDALCSVRLLLRCKHAFRYRCYCRSRCRWKCRCRCGFRCRCRCRYRGRWMQTRMQMEADSVPCLEFCFWFGRLRTYAWKSGHHVIIESIVQYVRMHKIHKATNSPVNVRIYANVAFWPQAARPSFEFAFRERIVISATEQRSKSQRHGQWLPFQSV